MTAGNGRRQEQEQAVAIIDQLAFDIYQLSFRKISFKFQVSSFLLLILPLRPALLSALPIAPDLARANLCERDCVKSKPPKEQLPQ